MYFCLHSRSGRILSIRLDYSERKKYTTEGNEPISFFLECGQCSVYKSKRLNKLLAIPIVSSKHLLSRS